MSLYEVTMPRFGLWPASLALSCAGQAAKPCAWFASAKRARGRGRVVRVDQIEIAAAALGRTRGDALGDGCDDGIERGHALHAFQLNSTSSP